MGLTGGGGAAFAGDGVHAGRGAGLPAGRGVFAGALPPAGDTAFA